MIKSCLIETAVNLYTPHREYFLDHFRSTPNTNVFSISRIPSDDVQGKLHSFLSENSPDYIFIDPWVCLPGKRDISFRSSNIIRHESFDKCCDMIFEYLTRKAKPKVVIMGGWLDVHSLTKADSTILESLLLSGRFLLWGLGANSYTSAEGLSSIGPEPGRRVSTPYYRRIMSNEKVRRRLVAYLHAWPSIDRLGSCWLRQYENFEFLVHVPGSISGKYPGRLLFRNQIASEIGSKQKRLELLLQNVRGNYIKTKSQELLALSNYLYYDIISKSRYNYADGGEMNYVTMKYLEIPAHGSVIVSPAMHTLSEYGFEPNKHFLSADENFLSDIRGRISMATWLSVRNQARSLVSQKHLIRKRVAQLYLALQLDLSDSLYSSHFASGDFFLNGKAVE